jgi:hypothetical protein
MTLASFRKLRTWTLRQRNRVSRDIEQEPHTDMNWLRKRLVGQLEAYDRVLDRMDAFIRFHRAAWTDKRKKKV